MTQKSIAIVGAGIAGLAAGCYAQMNGYRSRIYELHSIPGGLCTSWRRRGYTFDGGVRYLSGTQAWIAVCLDGTTHRAGTGQAVLVYTEPDDHYSR